jgi:carbamoyltransferase
VAERLARAGARFAQFGEQELLGATVDALMAEKAVGWFQGRMEFGPRALGNRSTIADPRSPTMQKTLNLRVKYRESFRPFAPAVLAEHAAEWFEHEGPSPYMLFVADVREEHRRVMSPEENALFGIDKLNVPRSSIPAVTHVDYSARLQTVHAETNPRFHALLSRFHDRTGCPVLVNTSSNVRGEPIVCTPEDAFRCFMGTDIDVLVAGDCLLTKEQQDPLLQRRYEGAFELD